MTKPDAPVVVGLWNDRCVFDASGGVYPATGGSGVAGAIKKGDIWTVSVAGTLPTGRVVEVGDVVRALINAAANTSADWAIVQNNIGYVTENSVNKSSNLLTPDNTKYPTTLAVTNALLDYQTVANNRYTFNNQTGTTYTVVAADVTTNGKVILKITGFIDGGTTKTTSLLNETKTFIADSSGTWIYIGG